MIFWKTLTSPVVTLSTTPIFPPVLERVEPHVSYTDVLAFRRFGDGHRIACQLERRQPAWSLNETEQLSGLAVGSVGHPDDPLRHRLLARGWLVFTPSAGGWAWSVGQVQPGAGSPVGSRLAEATAKRLGLVRPEVPVQPPRCAIEAIPTWTLISEEGGARAAHPAHVAWRS